MAKYKDPIELLAEFGIKLEHFCGKFKGRHVRWLEESGRFQIGDDYFDRWANSVDLEFELWLPKGQRKFIKWADSKQ